MGLLAEALCLAATLHQQEADQHILAARLTIQEVGLWEGVITTGQDLLGHVIRSAAQGPTTLLDSGEPTSEVAQRGMLNGGAALVPPEVARVQGVGVGHCSGEEEEVLVGLQ